MLTTFKQRIRGLALEPSSGGCFEISIDNELVYSKLATGSFPEEAAIVKAVEQRLR